MADMPGLASRMLASGGAVCSSDSSGSALFIQGSTPTFQSISVYSSHCSPQDFTASSPMINHTNKRKRRPAGTPDPDAEVVSLSPQTLIESDRYVCEICNQGFQREQNLQMHRRRHKVPWKLLKRESATVRKRVFVCPEPTCLHHDPSHALGDLVGIKKHFRRKHSTTKQWICHKCSKGYAVQSDYKAHLKTCGTRGHTCDCGRVFSRVESFIEHQDNCTATREVGDGDHQANRISISSCSRDPRNVATDCHNNNNTGGIQPTISDSNLSVELLQLMPRAEPLTFCHSTQKYCATAYDSSNRNNNNGSLHTDLRLTIGLKTEEPAMQQDHSNKDEEEGLIIPSSSSRSVDDITTVSYVDHVRNLAKQHLQIAEVELRKARKIRQEAEAELEKAKMLKEISMREAMRCHGCSSNSNSNKQQHQLQLQFQSQQWQPCNVGNNNSSLCQQKHQQQLSIFCSSAAEGGDENDCASMHERD